MTEGFNPTPVTASQKLKDAMARWNQNIEGVDADVDALSEAISEIASAEAAVRNLKSKLRRARANASVLLVGDSTADATDEWFYLLAGTFAAKYPAYTVQYRLFNLTNNSYDAAVTLQTGTGTQNAGGPYVLTFWNASVSGSKVEQFLGNRLETMYVAAAPDVIFVSHGHNEMSGHPAQRFRHRLLATTETLLAAMPFAQVVLIGQNPLLASDDMASRVDEIQNVASLKGYGFVDVHQAFVDAGKASYIQGDGVHPNAAGSLLWRDAVAAALFPGGASSLYLPPAAQPVSSFADPGTNILANGDFSGFSAGAVPSWTATNATLTTDATNYETGTYALKVTSATGAQSSISQAIANFREYRGMWATLAVRMRVASGQPTATGQVQIVDSAGAEISREPTHRDGFAWTTVSKRVSPTATSLSVLLFANVSTPISEFVVDRVALVKGVLPKDYR